MSRYESYNANPDGNRVGDCTVRAISTALGKSWESVSAGLAVMSLVMHDMPSADHVWGQYLRTQGFRRYIVPCRDDPCTVEEFCEDHPEGLYILALYQHVVCVIDGIYYDTWDSGGEYPIYYWVKEM